MKRFIPLVYLASALNLVSCAAHSNLVPLGKGNIESNIGVGGPFITLSNTKIPAPYFTLGTNYGLTEKMNLDATVHLTSFFYKVAGFDFGATWFPVVNEGAVPSWGVQPRLMLLASMKGNVESRMRLYPMLSSSAAWKWGAGLIYGGLDYLMLPNKLDYDPEAPRFILSGFAGYKWQFGESMSFSGELKWHGLNVEGNQLAPEYLSPGHGAIAVLFAISRSF